jgi:tetratricopeptide (TPR) repeat protein
MLVLAIFIFSFAAPIAFAEKRQAGSQTGESKDYAQILSDGKYLLSQKHFFEAEHQFELYTQKFPGDPAGYFWLGTLSDQSGDLDKAITWYAKSLEIAKLAGMDSEALRVNLGNTLTRQNKFDQAAFNYRRAIEINSKNLTAHLNLSKVLLLMGQYSQALDELNACDELGLEEPSTPLLRALALKNLGRVGEAKKEAGRYLETSSRRLPQLQEIARSLL